MPYRKPDKIGECSCCLSKDVPVWKSISAQHKEILEYVLLCELCRNTMAGNSVLWPSAGYDRATLGTICFVGNKILKAIEAMGDRYEIPQKLLCPVCLRNARLIMGQRD